MHLRPASIFFLGLACLTRAFSSLHAESPHLRSPAIGNLGEQRVITFKTVRTEEEGVKAEHWWTSKNLPGYIWKKQTLIQDDKRRIYDQVTLVNKKGQVTTVFFDITRWFGHR